MATVIGELLVNFRAGLGKYEDDLKRALGVTTTHATRMSSAFREQTKTANESAEFLSNTLGVHIPRSIRRLLAESSLIGPVLSAAFKATAITAVIALVVELAPKIRKAADELGGFTDKMKEADKAAKAANKEALEKFSNISVGRGLLNFTNTQITSLEKQKSAADALLHSDKLYQGVLIDHIKAWQDVRRLTGEILDLNAQRIEQTKQLTELQKKANEQLDQSIASGTKALATAGLSGVAKMRAELKQTEEEATKLANLSPAELAKKGLTPELQSKGLLDLGLKFEAQRRDLTAAYGSAGKQAADAFASALKSGSTSIRDALLTAIGKDDPLARINTEATKARETVVANLRDLNAAAAKFPQMSRQQFIDVLVARRDAASTEVEIERNKYREIEKAAEEAQKAVVIPTTAFAVKIPAVANNAFLNPEYLDAAKFRLKELGRNILDLRSTTLGYLNDIMTPSEQYKLVVDELNLAYQKQFINVDQLHKLTKQLSPVFQQIRAGAQAMGQAITDALADIVIHGGGAKQALAGVLEMIAKIVMQIALAKVQSGLTGLFTNILGSIFGGIGGPTSSPVGAGFTGASGFGIGSDVHFAGGGSVLPTDRSIMVGEHEPERWFPNGASGHITPMSQLGSAGPTIIYNIDARGSQVGVEQKIQRALRDTEDRAVARAQVAVRETNRRNA